MLVKLRSFSSPSLQWTLASAAQAQLGEWNYTWEEVDEQKACIYIASSHDDTEIANYNTAWKGKIIVDNSHCKKATFGLYICAYIHIYIGHTLSEAIISERQLFYVVYKPFARVNATVMVFFFQFICLPPLYIFRQIKIILDRRSPHASFTFSAGNLFSFSLKCIL